MFFLTEQMKIVEAITPQAGGAITGDYISLKNAVKAWVVVHINQANAAVVAITIEQATAVNGAGSTPITNVVPIWANEDCETSDTLVRQTDAVGFTTSAAVKHKVVIFQVDPASLSLADGDCITVKTAASNAANITSAMYFIESRYQQETPPSAITN
jgi:hypothetical protein